MQNYQFETDADYIGISTITALVGLVSELALLLH